MRKSWDKSDLLDSLLVQEEEAKKVLCDIHEDIKKERLRLAKEVFGVEVGSVVRDSQGKEFKVTKVIVQFSSYTKPWLEGNPRKKDGKFGVAHRCIYGDWDIVEESKQAE